LLEKKAKKLYDIAIFYEKQKKIPAAKMYYKEVYRDFPHTSYATLAEDRYESLEIGSE